jgi:hypothetical protein
MIYPRFHLQDGETPKLVAGLREIYSICTPRALVAESKCRPLRAPSSYTLQRHTR